MLPPFSIYNSDNRSESSGVMGGSSAVRGFSEDSGREGLDFSASVPGIAGEPGLDADLFQETDPIPFPGCGDLRQ